MFLKICVVLNLEWPLVQKLVYLQSLCLDFSYYRSHQYLKCVHLHSHYWCPNGLFYAFSNQICCKTKTTLISLHCFQQHVQLEFYLDLQTGTGLSFELGYRRLSDFVIAPDSVVAA